MALFLYLYSAIILFGCSFNFNGPDLVGSVINSLVFIFHDSADLVISIEFHQMCKYLVLSTLSPDWLVMQSSAIISKIIMKGNFVFYLYNLGSIIFN
jgi:hypothetical protein